MQKVHDAFDKTAPFYDFHGDYRAVIKNLIGETDFNITQYLPGTDRRFQCFIYHQLSNQVVFLTAWNCDVNLVGDTNIHGIVFTGSDALGGEYFTVLE